MDVAETVQPPPSAAPAPIRQTAAVSEVVATTPPSVWSRLLREHPTLVLTAVYLALTIIGLAYDFLFFLHFRIQILEFAQTSDYLLAAIRSPSVILLSLAPIPLVVLARALDRWLRRRIPAYDRAYRRYSLSAGRSQLTRVLRVVFVLVYALAFIMWRAGREADAIKSGRRRPVQVQLEGAPGGATETLYLLGASGSMAFFYDRQTTRTIVVPVDRIVRLTTDKVKPPR